MFQSSKVRVVSLLVLIVSHAYGAFHLALNERKSYKCVGRLGRRSSKNSVLEMAVTTKTSKAGYEPKWKKKKTLADDSGNIGAKEIGLIGTIPVVFKQGNETRSTMALVGQPISDVAAQAGQFIKYGCKKGECGTCEAMVNGKWIRPCVSAVPADLAPGVDYVVQVKDIASKSKSSGKFFSVRSFFMGFYNNLLGMVGFVKRRKAAKRSWDERQEYEDLIRRKTLEKKKAREAALAAAAKKNEGRTRR